MRAADTLVNVARRDSVDRALGIVAIALPAACVLAAVALWSGIDGGIRTIGDRSNAGARYLAFYTAPLLFALFVWMRIRLSLVRERRWSVLLVDACVVAGAALRFVVGTRVPFSGHMLFLTYSLLAAPTHRTYQAIALAVLAETTIFKLLVWSDARSWAWGMACGVAAAGMANVLSRRDRV